LHREPQRFTEATGVRLEGYRIYSPHWRGKEWVTPGLSRTYIEKVSGD
jgi:hypothetical protein